jgi:undecaprenyl diphosphate synthase
MPWQISYSEIYFIKVLWPDFSEEDFIDALEEYKRRNRRFGGV